MLASYDWPGNSIRQLENAIFRALVLSDLVLTPAEFPGSAPRWMVR